MASLERFVRNLLVRAPREFLVALARLVVLLVVVLFVLLAWLVEWYLRARRRDTLYPGEDEEEKCGKIPESVVRRPDPCLYSQRLLRSKGLPVTWDNPDVWVAPADDPGNVLPDSYHLEADTEYVVTVQVHNASATDPAIGTGVRLRYRPWSFNSPDEVPVETDADGDEVVRHAHVPPMGSDEVQFRWHTPSLAPDEDSKHFCLLASVHHPMDTNPANNVGQENTNVYRSENPGPPRPGERVEFDVPLFNDADEGRRFRFDVEAYEVADAGPTYDLDLETTRAYADWSPSQRLANLGPRLRTKQRVAVAGAEPESRLDLRSQRRVHAVRHRYAGLEAAAADVREQDTSLPEGMTVTVGGADPEEGLALKPGDERTVTVAVDVPEDVDPGTRVPLSVTARTEAGETVGGVTTVLEIEEGT